MINNSMAKPIKTKKHSCGECGGRGFVCELDGDGNEGEVICSMCMGTGIVETEE